MTTRQFVTFRDWCWNVGLLNDCKRKAFAIKAWPATFMLGRSRLPKYLKNG